MAPGCVIVVDDSRMMTSMQLAALCSIGTVIFASSTIDDAPSLSASMFDEYKPRPLPDRSWSRKASWGKPWARGSRR